ncbi:MAG: nicotinamide riboside transporter PnuC [Victivallales bacterium]|nr:nicotinamide riboside transporter PnuC [Victivallales bacterium]
MSSETGGEKRGAPTAAAAVKEVLRPWRPFEITWLAVFCLIALILTWWSKDTWLGFTAFITGVVCVVLTAKGSIWSFWWGYVNILTYAGVAYANGLYGEMGLNLLFFLPSTIVGLFMWRRNMKTAGHLVMRRLARSWHLALAVMCLIATVALGWGLSRIAGQNTPYIDALTDVLSIAATLLMVWRFREQWACWLTLDVFTVLMWSLRWAAGSPEGALMTTMWSAYLINAVYGWYNWSRGAEEETAACIRTARRGENSRRFFAADGNR